MATLQYYESFLPAFKAGKHDFRYDTLKVVLTNRPPRSGDRRLGDIRDLHNGSGYGGHPAGGLVLPGRWDGARDEGVYSTDELKFTATHQWIEQFRFLVIYNDATADDLLIGYYDYGQAMRMFEGETLTLSPSPTMLVLPYAAERQAFKALSA